MIEPPAEAVTLLLPNVRTELLATDGPEHFARMVQDAERKARRLSWPVVVHDHLDTRRAACNGRTCQLVFVGPVGEVVS